jgi:hypothetical protein
MFTLAVEPVKLSLKAEPIALSTEIKTSFPSAPLAVLVTKLTFTAPEAPA